MYSIHTCLYWYVLCYYVCTYPILTQYIPIHTKIHANTCMQGKNQSAELKLNTCNYMPNKYLYMPIHTMIHARYIPILDWFSTLVLLPLQRRQRPVFLELRHAVVQIRTWPQLGPRRGLALRGRRQGRRGLALPQRPEPSQLQEQPPIGHPRRKQDRHRLQNRLRHSLG